MAAIKSPAPPPRPTVPATPRLRDSCDACAVSKVKCTKAKPRCARCEKRGLQCKYILTRRSGRRRNPRINTGTVAAIVSSSALELGMLTPPTLTQLSPCPHPSSIADTRPLNDGSSPTDPSLWWPFTPPSSDVDNLMASPAPMPMLEAFDP